MKKQEDMALRKARSYRSVLTTGLRLYTENFRRLFKASWQMALLYALSAGALGTLATIKIPEITLTLTQQLATYQGVFQETLQQYWLILLELLGLMLLAIVIMALADAPILSKLKEHKETGTISTPPHWLTASPHLMGRTLKGTLFTLPFCIVLLPLFPLLLPFSYVVMKYVMDERQKYWSSLWHEYCQGMRYWGFLFLVFFVSLLLVVLASFVITLPANILQLANQAALTGQLTGDPLGMPSYMTSLTFITFTFCNFICFYVYQVTLVHNYYIYGSIETKEHEKNTLH